MSAQIDTTSVTSADSDTFLRDLSALTRHPHRLAGSDEGTDAITYIEERLRDSGVEDVYPLDVPVWLPEHGPQDVTLELDGTRVALQPLRANLVAAPVTPPEGLRGPLRYLGVDGSEDIADTDLRGAVVVLDYTVTRDAWLRAFERGAAAVIFRGLPDDTIPQVKHASVPADLPRFYAAADAETGLTGGVDLTTDRAAVTLRSAVRWSPASARNLIAVIPGSGAGGVDADDLVVFAAAVDGFGSVPTRSPAARRAANAALLLRAAERWSRDPPARTTVLMFLDAQSHGLEGARWVYDALHMSADEHEQLVEQHRAEAEAVAQRLDDLAEWSAGGPRSAPPPPPALRELLQRQADAAAADANRRPRLMRLTTPGLPADWPADQREHYEQLMRDAQRWDPLRRWLHHDDQAPFIPMDSAESPDEGDVINVLARAAESFLLQRFVELETETTRDRQRTELRAVLDADDDPGLSRLKLHVDLELSGDTPTWGVYVGNDTDSRTQSRGVPPSADAPGFYAPVLAHLRTVRAGHGAAAVGDYAGLDTRSLRDPWSGRRVVPAFIPTAGTVAGMFGHFHVAAVTTHDARPREGHPADTADNLDAARLLDQGDAALALFRAAIDAPGLPGRPAFKAYAQSRYPAWSPAGAAGPSAQWRIAGGLSEDRPAGGAMLQLWPTHEPGRGNLLAWSIHAQTALPFYEPARRLTVDANGRFALRAMHSHFDAHVATLGAAFDDRGAVTGISNRKTMVHPLAAAVRTDLIPARGVPLVFRPHELVAPGDLRVMEPGRDTPPRDNESLAGFTGATAFVYLGDHLDPRDARLFQTAGPVRLFPAPEAAFDGDLLARSARDLWILDDTRLQQLRDRAIIRADLETLHRIPAPGSFPSAASPDGDTDDDVASSGSTAAHITDGTDSHARTSYALSRRVYAPLRAVMNDLIVGVVVLLGLTIPFAFALERLLIGAAGVHGRVAGFTAIFIATFVLLYLTHPGFAIASTPVLIFLAFAILLLSGLVIVLLLRKFRVELHAIQGQGGAAHRRASSQAATLIAAMQIGISAMRRRKIRTGLTIATVTVLTFTVVCFAGFEPRLAVRVQALGPTPGGAPAQAALVRGLNYQPLPGALAELVGEGAQDVTVEPMWWASSTELPLARADDGSDTQLRAALGVTPATVQRWPALARALGPATADEHAAALEGDGVYLPPRTARRLGLEKGDPIRLGGLSTVVAGTFDPDALTRLRHLDARPVLPVDFLDAASAQQGGSSDAQESELSIDSSAQEFQYLSATQTAIAGAELVRRLDGTAHMLTVFGDEGGDVAALAEHLARVAPTPVWSAGPAGLERRLLAMGAELDAGPTLLVPLALGGLIVFGTLLGSITDRRDEIATFSALGLGPGHVGALFLAEAAVYAVVGGMGGQLLAQVTAATAAALAERGIGRPLPINYASGNALLAIAAVSATVLLSALYPAWRAARSANPGVARAWKPPTPDGDALSARLPFTLSAYDMTGVMAFLAEHLAAHADAGLGRFATQAVALRPDDHGRPELHAEVALAPFDLGVTQSFSLSPAETDLPGVDEVAVHAQRRSGTHGDWTRTNRVFLRDLRRQFLLWRTLTPEVMQRYRHEALGVMGSGERHGDGDEGLGSRA